MQNYEGIIHLDSNVIDKRLLVNTTASFTNYLDSCYTYQEDKYEAALLDIHLPFTWCNISKPQYIAIFDNKSLKIKHKTLICIDPHHYKNTHDLIDIINQKMMKFIYKFPKNLQDDLTKLNHLSNYQISFDDVSNRVIASLVEEMNEPELGDNALLTANQSFFPDCHLRFTPELADILGFTDYQFIFLAYERESDAQNKIATLAKMQTAYFNQKPYMMLMNQVHDKELLVEDHQTEWGGFYEVYDSKLLEFTDTKYLRQANRQPDMTWGIDYIFCYSDLVKGHGVAGTSTPMLRALPVTTLPEYGKILPFSFTNPHYYPLAELSFDKINIELRDRTGELIPFLSGSVIALIEIRKRRKRYHGE